MNKSDAVNRMKNSDLSKKIEQLRLVKITKTNYFL